MGKAGDNYCESALRDEVLRPHHDKEHGFPSDSDDVLFERLMLEVMQAGLNWKLIINKRAGMRKSFDNFTVSKVAAYGEDKIASLLQDTAIIRSQGKINAAIHNAQAIQNMSKMGGFSGWLDEQSKACGADRDLWLKAMRKQFKFVGPEIVKEFLQGCGYIDGAHQKSCPVYAQIAALKPRFLEL